MSIFILIPAWPWVLFPKVFPTASRGLLLRCEHDHWEFFLQHLTWGSQENASFFMPHFYISWIAFQEYTAIGSRCLRVESFLFGPTKCCTTGLPYWVIFNSRNSLMPHLRPGSNLKVITFGQSSDAAEGWVGFEVIGFTQLLMLCLDKWEIKLQLSLQKSPRQQFILTTISELVMLLAIKCN